MISSTKLRVSSSFLCVCGGRAWAAISAQSPIPPPSRLAHAPDTCSLIGLPTLSPSRPCILAHVPADESLCQLTLFPTLCEKRVSAPTTLTSGHPSPSKDSSFNLHLKHSAGGILSLRFGFSRHYESTTARGQHQKAHARKPGLHLTRQDGTPSCNSRGSRSSPCCNTEPDEDISAGLLRGVRSSRPRTAWALWRPPQGSHGREVSQVQASSGIFSDTAWAHKLPSANTPHSQA